MTPAMPLIPKNKENIMQETYTRTDLIITEFDAEDAITTSGPEGAINNDNNSNDPFVL